MTFRLKLPLLLLLFAFSMMAQGKTGQILYGTVYDSEHEPLEFVTEDHFTLLDSLMDYVEKNGTDLDEVVVRGKNSIQQIKEGVFSVNVIDLAKYANTTTDINQVLRRTTGVTIREDGGIGSDFVFKINGLDAKVFIDGVPMENFGSSMTLNNIPVNLVERVEIYKGVVPAYLGTDALGGAVNIITKRKNRSFLDASYGYGSFDTHQGSLVGSYTDFKSGFTVKASAFYNSSDNDYTMYTDKKYNVVLEAAQNGKYVQIDKAKRFHDAYRSAMGKVEAGFENRRWADRLLFGLLYSENKKENQLGATVNTVKGGEWSENRFIMPSLHYRKDSLFFDNLYADLYVGYSKSTTHVRDTATYVYDWSGRWATTAGTPLEETHYKYVYDNYMGRMNLNYNLREDRTQSLNLSYNYNTIRQKTYDLIDDETLGLPARLTRHIGGLSWQGQWFHRKLVSIASVKYYGMDAMKDLDERSFASDGTVLSGAIVTHHKYFDFLSPSVALRYSFQEDLGVKASFERAYNLPEMTALFGDGQNYLANFELKPERSDNYNAGIFYNTFIGKSHSINFEVSGFYRRAKDFINTQIVQDSKGKNVYQYYNSPGVILYGLETELKYGYKDLLNITLNGSYDKAINNWKYTDDTKSQVSLVYKEQLPNRPWLYGNADFTIGKRNLLGKGTRIELTYLYQYIHWFYLSWESLGGKSSKNYVPTQTIHSLVASYSWHNDRYSLSFEGRNLTDERCYDNFRLQKPGRAFYTKFRISLM